MQISQDALQDLLLGWRHCISNSFESFFSFLFFFTQFGVFFFVFFFAFFFFSTGLYKVELSKKRNASKHKIKREVKKKKEKKKKKKRCRTLRGPSSKIGSTRFLYAGTKYEAKERERERERRNHREKIERRVNRSLQGPT